MPLNINCNKDVDVEPPCEVPPLPTPAPSVSAEWCLDGDQIVVIYQVPGPDNEACPPIASPAGTPEVLGYFDAAGTWIPGPPPAGYGPCSENADFELAKWCACDAAGEVIGIVLVQYEYDEDTHELVGTTVLNPDGTPFTEAYDSLCLCPVTIDPQVAEVAVCVADDAGNCFPGKMVQTIDLNADGTIAGILDAKLYNALDLTEVVFPLLPGWNLTYGPCDASACQPYLANFVGEAAPVVEPFNVFSIMKPACCEVTITTDAGTVVIPQGMTSYCPSEFECALTSVTLAVTDGDCTIDEIHLFVQNTGKVK